jgi:K+-sensing histidine kinase KdpD
MRSWILSSVGPAACIAAAGVTSLVFYSSSIKNILPVLFLVLILFVVLRFGSMAGVLGTIAIGLIFAIFLFEPRFNLLVADIAARSRLIWMVLIGIIVSGLLGHPAAGNDGPSTSSRTS